LGLAAFGSGDDRSAVAWLEQSLALYSQINRAGWVAGASIYLGPALVRCGDLARARPLLVNSVLIAQANRDDHGVAEAVEGLASLAAAEGRSQRAVRLCVIAADIRARIGIPVAAWDRRWLDAVLATAGAASSDLPSDGSCLVLPVDEVVQYALERDDVPKR
jgi:hypothetical protein